MKRHVKKLINNWVLAIRGLKVELVEFYHVAGWRIVVGVLIATICVVGMATEILKDRDYIPAATSDYQPLENQAHMVDQNRELLWEIESKIEIQENLTIVEFRNDKCELIAEYDNKNFKLQSTKKQQSNYHLWFIDIPIFLVAGGICWLVFGIVLIVIICILEDLLCGTYAKILRKS